MRYAKGEVITNPHPILKLFADCERMRWTHLPVAGGLYDQHPDLLDGFRLIWHEQAQEEAKREKARNKNQGAGRSRVAGRRR